MLWPVAKWPKYSINVSLNTYYFYCQLGNYLYHCANEAFSGCSESPYEETISTIYHIDQSFRNNQLNMIMDPNDGSQPGKGFYYGNGTGNSGYYKALRQCMAGSNFHLGIYVCSRTIDYKPMDDANYG